MSAQLRRAARIAYLEAHCQRGMQASEFVAAVEQADADFDRGRDGETEEDRLRSALQAAERERDEARAALDAETHANELANKVMAQSVANVTNDLVQERDSARLEAGRLAQELDDVTRKLALAAVEVGRLREEREHDRKWIEHVRKQCGVTGDGSIIELVQGLRAAVESIRIASDGFERCEVIGESSVALKQQLGWINARARQALKPKEVAGG